MGKQIDIGRVFADLPLFQQLRESEIVGLAAGTREIGLDKGRVLFQKGSLLDGRDIPRAIDTDVNAAVLAEAELGAAKGFSDAVYITVGTGVGGGVLSGGKLVHGLLHPEVGHMLLRPRADDPNPRGVCPYHDGCLEGLAAGPAIGARVGGDAKSLPDNHPTFVIEADYLAQMCVNLIVTLSPQKIILGGGVMQRTALFPMIQEYC